MKTAFRIQDVVSFPPPFVLFRMGEVGRGFFKSAHQMAADSSVPVEMRELGRVLSRILAGDTNADLSGLPDEWREAVKKSMQT